MPVIRQALQTVLPELQDALYVRLSSDTELMALVTGVFDNVPNKQPMPYVRIGEPLADTADTKTSAGEDASIVLHIWSGMASKHEANMIINACLKAIGSTPLILQGFKLQQLRVDQKLVIDDIDGKSNHGIIRLTALVK